MNRTRPPSYQTGIVVLAVLCACAAAGLYMYLKRSSQRTLARQEESFRYDASATRRVDPTLIRFRQAGQIDTGLANPVAIAVTSKGQVFVAGDRQVRALTLEGAVARKIDLSDNPTCLAARDDGSLAVGFIDRVELYDAAGNRQASWAAAPKGSYLTSVCLSGTDVWVADAGRRVVMRCDASGRVLLELGKGDLNVPSPHLDVGVAPDGVVWLANPGKQRLEAYTPGGGPVRQFGRPGTAPGFFPGCCNPTDFVILPDGNIAASEKGAARVTLYRPDGTLDCVVADVTMLGDTAGAMDLAADGRGRIYVLDTPGRTVRIFARRENR